MDMDVHYTMCIQHLHHYHQKMGKIVDGIVPYCKAAKKMGFRNQCKHTDFSDIFQDENVEDALKEAAEVFDESYQKITYTFIY